MKSTACSLVLAFLAILAAAPARADDEKKGIPYTSVEDVVYGQKDGMGLTLDVLTPRDNAKGIGVILISSGSWRSRKSNVLAEDEPRRRDHWVQGLLGGGYTLFVTRHGSAPRYFVPEMIEDIRRSVRFVRLHAREYGVDPDHLGITSGSSGGHLALAVGLTGDDGNADAKDPVERASSRVQAIVAWFPPTDMINWGTADGYKSIESSRPGFFKGIFGEVKDLEAQLRAISPIYQVTKDDPPVLLIHGDKDATVPLQQSEIFKAKYEEIGLPVQLVVHPGGGHTYWPGILNDYAAVTAWFDKYLGGKAPAAAAGP
ncbi:MAG: alpha/beta hydrolase [Planctomycetia bacterium]|nr:alpha/beta hydrolase [Planctomycetia bacterium]